MNVFPTPLPTRRARALHRLPTSPRSPAVVDRRLRAAGALLAALLIAGTGLHTGVARAQEAPPPEEEGTLTPKDLPPELRPEQPDLGPIEEDLSRALGGIPVQSTPLEHWVERIEQKTGKNVTTPYHQGVHPPINLIGDHGADPSYDVIQAILESNGYDVTEDLRSDLIRVRHARNRVRTRISEIPPPDEEEVRLPFLVTWVRRLGHLDVESTFDTVRQLLRVRHTRSIGSVYTSLRVEMVLGERTLIVTGDPGTVLKVKHVLERVDSPFTGDHPQFNSYSLHHITVEEFCHRLERMIGIPYEILQVDENSGSIDLIPSRGFEDFERDAHFARLLGLPNIGKVVLETNHPPVTELVASLVQLLDKRDPVLRASTFVYHAQHRQVATLERYLRQYIGGGGVPPVSAHEEGETLIPTRIVTHDLSNALIVQCSSERYRHMLEFLQSIDVPR